MRPKTASRPAPSVPPPATAIKARDRGNRAMAETEDGGRPDHFMTSCLGVFARKLTVMVSAVHQFLHSVAA